MSAFRILAVCTPIVAGCALAQTLAPLAQPVPFQRIAVLGDSNSDPDPYFDAWWEFLGFVHPEITVTWHGWSGATAIGDGVAQALAARQTRPDLVLVMLGTNDLGPHVPGPATVEQVEAAYDAIRAALAPIEVRFLGPPEVMPWGPCDASEAAAANALAAGLDVDIPLVGKLGPEAYKLPVDGLHLDGEGQRQLGFLALEALGL